MCVWVWYVFYVGGRGKDVDKDEGKNINSEVGLKAFLSCRLNIQGR